MFVVIVFLDPTYALPKKLRYSRCFFIDGSLISIARRLLIIAVVDVLHVVDGLTTAVKIDHP